MEHYLIHLRKLIEAAREGTPKSAQDWAKEFGCHVNTVRRMAKCAELEAAILPSPPPTAPTFGTVSIIRRIRKDAGNQMAEYAAIGQKVLRRANMLGHEKLEYTVIHDGAILITAPGVGE